MEYINLKTQYRYLKSQIDSNIQRAIDSSSFIMGSFVEELEEELSRYVGVKYAITCSDGTSALQLIYMAHSIGKGDAVFCPNMTFIASIEPACLLGAVPVFCDIDEHYNIDPASLERQINKVISEGKYNPKAVVAVDFLGNPADYDSLREITNKYNLLLVEDAAQSMGASYKGKKCGSLGDVAATSFFPSKPLGCYGDGGAIFTDDEDVYRLLTSLRVHGKGRTKYDNIHIGINSRLDNIQAGILLPKLAVLDEEIRRRQLIAEAYNNGLKEFYIVPNINDNSISAYAQYVLYCESAYEREIIQQKLNMKNIPTIRYYPNTLDMLPVFKGINIYGEDLSKSRRYAECTFGIPFSPYMGDDEVDFVIRSIRGRV